MTANNVADECVEWVRCLADWRTVKVTVSFATVDRVQAMEVVL